MTYHVIDQLRNLNSTTPLPIEVIEKNYNNCCKESSWLEELYSLIEFDERSKIINQVNDNFNNLKINEEEIQKNDNNNNNKITINSNSSTTTTTTTTSLIDSTNITIDNDDGFNEIQKLNNDKVIISSVLSKLSYFNDKESIIWYLKSISEKTHVFDKIKKMYYFKPIHTRTKLLIAFDDKDNMYCAFQGTVNSGDLVLDICCGFLEKITFSDTTGPKHSLFSACLRIEWATSLVGDLLSIANRFNKKSLIFCGHSIGGTFALLPALEAIKIQKLQPETSGIQLKCFTFGSPSFLHPSCKLILDENKKYNEIFENYLNEFDIVPMMSHHPFIFIDFMYLIICLSTILFTIGYHLTNGGNNLIDKGIDQLLYNLIYPFIMLSIPLLIIKLMYVIYQYFFSLGLQSKFTRVYTHSRKGFIFFENQDQDVEFNFKSIINHIKKLKNYKKLILIHDHKMDSYLSHLFNHYQIGGYGGSNGNNGTNIDNILTSNDIVYLKHCHPETIESSHTLRTRNKILKKGLLLMGFCHILWLFLSIPIFYKSLYYLCLIKTNITV